MKNALAVLAALALWFVLAGFARAAPFPTACLQTITVGQTISGSLASTDCGFTFSGSTAVHYYDVYAFTGTAGQQIAISMSSTAFDTVLELYNVNDISAAALVSNDDIDTNNTNSRIPQGTGFFTLPASGTYYILAWSIETQRTGAYTLSLTTNATSDPAQVTVFEFYHPTFNHYFITAYPAEVQNLSSGGLPPWVATGQQFKAWAAAGTNIVNVCRFFNNSFAPKSSHFYSHASAECPSLAQRSSWQLEANNAFYMMRSSGTCPSGTMPLYRLYNNGMSGAPNHRYTNNPQIRSQMIAAGWIPEGNGADGVFACVPQSALIPPNSGGSAFQQETTGYINRILGLVSGSGLNLDQITVLLGATFAALGNPASTCPRVTTNPPLTNLTTIPSTLSFTSTFGGGCSVPNATPATTMAGTATLNLTNVTATGTAFAANYAVSLDNIKANGALVGNGTFTGSANITSGSAGTLGGTLSANVPALQVANGTSLSGTLTMTLGTPNNLVTNITFSPDNVNVRLNVNIASQADGSLVVNTNASGTNTVGGYTVQMTNLKLDPRKCSNGAVGGTISFTRQGQTGTFTFNSTCSFTYSGP